MVTNIDPQEYFDQAVETYQKGNDQQAEKMLRLLLESFPDNDAVLNMLGAILIDNEPIEATFLLKKAVQINPQNTEALVNLSFIQKKRGWLKEALSSIQKARHLHPDRADIAYNEGEVLLATGRYEEAEDSFLEAIQLDPTLITAYFNLGKLYYDKRETEKAKAAFEKALSLDPDYIPALINLGNLTADEGYFAEAEPFYLKVLQTHPDHPEALSVLGRLYLDLDRTTEAKKVLQKSIDINDYHPDAHVLLGNIAKDDNQPDKAESHYRYALEIEPTNEGAQRNLRRLLNSQIPGWHFVMLADDLRNDAYQQAIEWAVSEGSIVLDIGTGSGLLAMMAARAGAQQVVACEMHPRLAETAQQIIYANGLVNRIKVINKKSTALEVGSDLPEKANVLVSEILDAGVIGEGVLPTVRHAINNLLEEDAIIIPAKVSIFGQLVEIPMRSKVSPIKEISGFDLSAFDQYRIQDEYLTIHLMNETYQPLSEVFPIAAFNFYNLPAPVQDDDPISKRLSIPLVQSGEVQAVVFWFDLTLHKDLIVSSRPGGELKHWGQALFCFENPIKANAGDPVNIDFIRSDQLIWFELKQPIQSF